MTAATPLPRRRALAAAAALLALLATLLVPSTARAADAGAEAAFVSAVNRERAAAGLPALAVADDLVAVARQHSVRMADSDNLHHNPNLSGDVGGWQKVGENVGRGPDIQVIHQAFMDSPGHRQNILDGDWTQVGVGVEVRDGRVWVTEVFRQPAAAPAPPPPPEPEPEPEPAPTTAPAPEPAPEPEAPAPAPPAPASAPPAPASTPATEAPARTTAEAQEPTAEPTPEAAPADDRALVMLTRVAAEDAALDAA